MKLVSAGCTWRRGCGGIVGAELGGDGGGHPWPINTKPPTSTTFNRDRILSPRVGRLGELSNLRPSLALEEWHARGFWTFELRRENDRSKCAFVQARAGRHPGKPVVSVNLRCSRGK